MNNASFVRDLSTSGTHVYWVPTVLQDTSTLELPIQQNQAAPTINISRPRINLERLQSVIDSTEKREQKIIQQRRMAVARVEPIYKPSVEIDTLMAKYQYMGCVRAMDFPEKVSLTAIERYYQSVRDTTTFSYPMVAASDVVPFADSTSLDSLLSVTPPRTFEVVSQSTNVGFVGDARILGYPSTLTIILMAALVFLTWIKFHFGKNLVQSVTSFFNYQQACRMLDERRESDRHAALYANILSNINMGIFLTLSLPFFGITLPWGSYGLSILFFALIIGILYVFKSGIWKMLGNIFMAQDFSQEYVYNMYLYTRNVGLFIFPFILAIPFVADGAVPFLIYSVVSVVCLFYLIRLFRIFQIIRAQNIAGSYFILYLCTLEILPLLLLFKTLKVLSNF